MKLALGQTKQLLAPWILALGFVVALGQGPALGKQRPLFDTPVYHEPSKSYYELIDMKNGSQPRYQRMWHHAYNYAVNRTFKGVKGHLAVIDTPEVHAFLRDNLRPDKPSWIGLRYFCQYGKSQWVTGRILDKTDYKNWNQPWDLSGRAAGVCAAGYLPIYATRVSRGFRWAAQGPGKNWHYMIVQYPTGRE